MTFPFPHVVPVQPTIEFVGTRSIGVSGSGGTFTSMGLGRADATKRIYVVIYWTATNAYSINSLSVGGVAATRLALSPASALRTGVAIYQFDTALDAANIAASWSGSLNGGATISVYAHYNRRLGGLYGSPGINSSSSNVSSLSVAVNTVSVSTFVLVGATQLSGSGTMLLTNAVRDTTTGYDCSGHDFYPPTATGRAIAVAFGISTSPAAMAAVVLNK